MSSCMFYFILPDSNLAAQSEHHRYGGSTLTQRKEHLNPESDIEVTDLSQKPPTHPNNIRPGQALPL